MAAADGMKQAMYYALALAGVCATSWAHVLMKSAVHKQEGALAAWLHPRSICAYTLLAAAVFITAYTIRELEYGVVVALSALSYPLVATMSVVVLREKIDHEQRMAQAMVFAGVVLYCLPI